ncbi:hypothetical protein M0R89_10495 [Halorussus limi]|uniref:Uncharacterized protein n=1 Tax=Halorussus limi TaxID=2938695 RepID=A0A8U0HQ30_9EURY|nr:hypothetical protein [Halorussus limi]UPV72977.1 hypothetical protein M0R89_10495 [Halorussus limi]
MPMWKTVVTVLLFIFTMVMVQAAAGPALESTGEKIKSANDLDTRHWDGESLIDGMISSFFDGIMVAIFGILIWGVAYSVRKERYLK